MQCRYSSSVLSTMKHTLPVIIWLLFSCRLFAQKNLVVVYNELNIVSFEKQKRINDFNRQQYLYIHKDTLAFYSFGMQEPDKKNNTVGSKKDHHSLFIFPKLSRLLSENYWVRPYHLKEFTLPVYNWSFHTDTMHIAGYVCNVAVADGLVAWYTPEITPSLGPLTYYGLPGLILMLEDHKNRRLYTAISIKQHENQIVLPDLPIRACDKCDSKLEEIKQYFKN